jgi:hypothetical protein
MVVVAVRDAEIVRAVPLPVKMLVAAGFALACWLLCALSGNLSAAADDQSTTVGTAHYGSPGLQPRELMFLRAPETGLLVPLGSSTAVADTVDQVRTSVTGSVTNTVATAGTAGTALVAPVSTILAPPQPVLVPAAQPANSAPRLRVANTASPRLIAPASRSTPPQPLIGKAAAPYPPAEQRRATAPRHQAHAHTVEFRGTVPAPAPAAPGSQFCGIAVVYDGGSNIKHPPAILGGSAGVPRPHSIGVSRPETCAETGRDQALPTTSPD